MPFQFTGFALPGAFGHYRFSASCTPDFFFGAWSVLRCSRMRNPLGARLVASITSLISWCLDQVRARRCTGLRQNDYEGIGGYEEYRGDLALMYFPTLDCDTGCLRRLAMTPTRHFCIDRASEPGRHWLFETLNREGQKLGTRMEQKTDPTFLLRWN